MIPLHKFEFVDLGDLFGLASSYEKPDSPDFSTSNNYKFFIAHSFLILKKITLL